MEYKNAIKKKKNDKNQHHKKMNTQQNITSETDESKLDVNQPTEQRQNIDEDSKGKAS